MKPISLILIFYLTILMAMQLHSAHSCDHNLEQTEYQSDNHSETPCCPPFTSCEVCSTMILTLSNSPFIPVFSAITQTYPQYTEYPAITIASSIWQPPKFIKLFSTI